jgi:hypothetical protein
MGLRKFSKQFTLDRLPITDFVAATFFHHSRPGEVVSGGLASPIQFDGPVLIEVTITDIKHLTEGGEPYEED